MDFTTLALKTGETKQLGVFDKDGNAVSTATFTSTDATVASVSESGLVTALKAGSTTVKAKVGEEELTCSVTVTQKYTYSLDKSSLDIAAGGSGKLTLNVSPELGDDARPHTFSSSDTGIATVEGGSGKVTGVAKGTATITCLVDGEELKATVTVTEYTVKIGDEALGAETSLRVGANKDITVTADPERTVEAVYDSSDKTVATVEGGHIVPLKEGTTTITVTVGGRTYSTALTVSPSTIYEINKEEATLRLGETGNTVQLEVTRDPEGEVEVEYESSDATVATVSESGLVTAKKLGTATITARVKNTDVSFTVTISVVLDSSLAHEDYTFGSGSVNLTRLDANKTLDWRMWYAEDGYATRMKDKTDLIGDVVKSVTDEKFWDYKTPIFYEDGDSTGKPADVYTYGRAIHGSYSIPVKLTNAVSKVIIFTGSWKEEATIEFKIGDAVLQSETFSAGEIALARGYVLTVDTDALADGETLDLTVAVNCARANGGNVSLAAVAVVGKTAHTAASASVTGKVTSGLTGEHNLTEAGGIDWASANGTTKAGVEKNSVIDVSGIVYTPQKGTANNYAGATITWTDGTAAAPAGLKDYCHAGDSIEIPVHLDKGKSAVTLFATGWNCGYLVAVYDKNGAFVGGYQGADEKKGESVTSRIEMVLTVAESGEYTFKIMKCRGSGNVGWAAIAVSSGNDFEPAKLAYDMTKGEEATIALTGEGTVPAATYVSGDETVATVDASGKITALKAGKTYITVSYAGVERTVSVTVTEYKISSATSVSLFIGGKSTVQIVSDPAGHSVNATFELAADEDKIQVSAGGEITALKAGEAQITVKVDGREIGKVTVTIAGYTLNKTQQTIITASGTGTFKLEVITNPDAGTVANPAQVTFTSSDDDIVTVAADGTVTAVGVGEATVTAVYDGVELTCTVTACVLPVTTQVTDYANSDNTVNLSKLDDTKGTLDWHYFGNGFEDEMKGGALIGELTGERAAYFYDYRAKINWSNGTVRESSYTDLTDGWTFKGTASFTVSLTDKVDYIAIFVGAYHAKNTIEVKIGDKVHTVYSFENRGDNDVADKNKQIRIYPDVTEMKTAQTVTVSMTCGEEGANQWHDNISLVAIAVVGKDARTADPANTVTASVSALMPEEDNTLNISEVGTLDWVYVKNGNGGMTRKAGVIANSIIKANAIKTQGGDGYDTYGNKKQYFSWTDGVDALAGEKVNNFQWINDKYYIPVHLPKGENEVILYLSGWKCSYFVTVIDNYGNKLLDAQNVVEGDGTNSKAVAVKVAVNAAEAGTFTFLMTKSGDGNHGWAAVAVAQKSEYTLTHATVNAALGGNAPAPIEVKKGDETVTEGISYTSSDASVVTVSETGVLAALKAGTAIVTVSVGNTQLLVFVHVTEYALDSSDSITLPLEKTSQIQVVANPEGAVNATYASDNEEVATVSVSGLITAVGEGEAKITVTIDGKTFEITVNAVSYELNVTSMKLTVGKDGENTQQLSMLDGSNNAVALGVTYEAVDSGIVEISPDGTVSAVGIGKTKIRVIHAELNIVFECEVVCVIDMATSEIDYEDGSNSTINLDELDDTNETLDWHFFRGEIVHKMNGGDIIGDLKNGRIATFGDYRAHMTWYNGTSEKASIFGYTDGWTFKTVSFDVTVTSDVKYISIFTGAWHAKNVISISHNGVEYAKYEFVNNGSNDAHQGDDKLDKNKQIVFTPDTEHLGAGSKTFTITITAENNLNGWSDNVSLVAIAVVGNSPRPAYTHATAQETHTSTVGGDAINLTEVGTLDWMYICDNSNGMVKKEGIDNVIHTINAIGGQGGGGDHFENQTFTWSDGTKAHEGASTDYFKWCDNVQAINVTLTESAKVTLWISAWQGSVDVSVYDRTTEVLAATRVIDGNGSSSQGVKVEFTLTVTEETIITFRIKKDGGGNFGLGAVAVAALPEQQ